ncbi:MAG: exosome complex RNA-binding protein Rrp4 [Candidatus Pacearchaeota archaeon]|nr:exosome complex RNA-binding protein Rrp4 [Candidatus Pacearchaeota archaeon]
MEKTRREIVIPGEIVGSGSEFLPGEGTRKEGKDIIALRFGLLEKNDKIVRVIPLSGTYIPRTGNTVIGQVIDITFNGWVVDILSPYLGFLPINECAGYVNKNDLSEYYDIHDLLASKVHTIRTRSVELTMKDRTCKKLVGGFLMRVNPTRVPRIIGREGSMVNIIKKETNCNIIVGQNGLIWIKGPSIEEEILARDAIKIIAEKPFVEGLTDYIKEFLEKNKK